MNATDFAWLIEAPGPYYLATRILANETEFHWTKDAGKALRFCSLQQASSVHYAVKKLVPTLFAFASVLTDAKPVEHGFVNSST